MSTSIFETDKIDVTAYKRESPPDGEIRLWWLGQAGFLIQSSKITCIIDSYLSDSLAKKYAGKEFPHKRMMPPPLHYDDLTGIDVFFSTHAHSDHLDPEGLEVLASVNPECRFVIAASSQKRAVERGVPEDRIVLMNGDSEWSFADSLRVSAIPSAHERLECDDEGNNLYLGYVMDFEGLRVYHSGDCVPYDSLAPRLLGMDIHLALLPVNGRDTFRTRRGVPGNFRYEEGRDLLSTADIPYLIPHHFGMFDFNTVQPDKILNKIESDNLGDRVRLAEVGIRYKLVGIK